MSDLKRTVRTIGIIVTVLFAIGVTIQLATAANAAVPSAHHKTYTAGCDRRWQEWEAAESGINIGSYTITLHRCWNTNGNITSESMSTEVTRTAAAVATEYHFSHSSNSLDESVTGKIYFWDNYGAAQLCPGVTLLGVGVHLCGFNEQFDAQTIIESPSVVAADGGGPWYVFSKPVPRTAGEKGYGLSWANKGGGS